MTKNNAIVFVFYGGKLLLIFRDDKPGVSNPGMWGLPGGGANQGETPMECMLRECREESNVTPSRFSFLGKEIGEERYRYVAYLSANEVKGIRLGNEGQGIGFFSFEEMLSMTLTPRLKEWINLHEPALRELAEEKEIVPERLGLERARQGEVKFDKTVLVGGCFDLIHEGHIRLLDFAKSLTTGELHVAVLTNRHIKTYKGDDRPIQDEQVRLEIVRNIHCVNRAFLMDGNAYTEEYLSSHPEYSIIVIGYDGTSDSDTAAKEDWGKRLAGSVAGLKVVLLERLQPEFVSTTKVIEKLRILHEN